MGTRAALKDEISNWAQRKSANVSLSSYQTEIEIWQNLTGETRLKSAIEVGSGSGLFSATLLEENIVSEVIALDPIVEGEGTTEEELQKLKPSLKSMFGEKINFKKGKFPQDLPDKNVDLMVFRKSLHHIYEAHNSGSDEVVQGLEVVRDHLNDNGWIYILESSEPPVWTKAAITVKRRANGVGPIQWSGKRGRDEWITLLEDAGFSNIQAAQTPYNIVENKRVLGPTSRYLSNRHLITAQS